MSEVGDGAREYLKFLNYTIEDIQRLFKVELTQDETMKLRLALNEAIAKVITDDVLFREENDLI